MIEQYDWPELEGIYWSGFSVVEFINAIKRWMETDEAVRLMMVDVEDEQ